jgi:hypothetical protein
MKCPALTCSYEQIQIHPIKIITVTPIRIQRHVPVSKTRLTRIWNFIRRCAHHFVRHPVWSSMTLSNDTFAMRPCLAFMYEPEMGNGRFCAKRTHHSQSGSMGPTCLFVARPSGSKQSNHPEALSSSVVHCDGYIIHDLSLSPTTTR